MKKNIFLVIYINISSKLITYVSFCYAIHAHGYMYTLYIDHYITVHIVHKIVIINAALLTHIIYSIKKNTNRHYSKKNKTLLPQQNSNTRPPPPKKKGKILISFNIYAT